MVQCWRTSQQFPSIPQVLPPHDMGVDTVYNVGGGGGGGGEGGGLMIIAHKARKNFLPCY